MGKARYSIRYYERPGVHLGDDVFTRLAAGVRAVGERCLDPVPDYQVMLSTREAWSDKVITVAFEGERPVGFSSGVVLDVEGVGEVFHLGLMCTDPDVRGGGLSHRLASKQLLGYAARRSLKRLNPARRLWVTNVANVLSSLGNFALVMEGAWPAPGTSAPPPEALRIGEAFDKRYRRVAYVRDDAVWDAQAFVWRGSGRDTAFHKDGEDARFHHRDAALTDFYRSRLNFEDGDEMLQVGSMNLLGLLRYATRGRR